jgi:hypothetical protein
MTQSADVRIKARTTVVKVAYASLAPAIPGNLNGGWTEGKFFDALTDQSTEINTPTTHVTVANKATGRQRGESKRPLGKRSIRKIKGGKLSAIATSDAHTSHCPAGSEPG